MTIFKSLEYSSLRICNVDDDKVIDWICSEPKLISQFEPNKYLNEKKKDKQSRIETTNKPMSY